MGASSSSVMVKSAPETDRPGAVVVPETERFSPAPSSRVSWVGSMEKVADPVVAPAEMVMVKSFTVA